MLEDPMLPEFFAVVRGDDHKSILQQPAGVELGEQQAQVIVEIRQCAIVGVEPVLTPGTAIPASLNRVAVSAIRLLSCSPICRASIGDLAS